MLSISLIPGLQEQLRSVSKHIFKYNPLCISSYLLPHDYIIS